MTKAEKVGMILLAAIIAAVALALLLKRPAHVADCVPTAPPCPVDSLILQKKDKPERAKPHGSPTPASRDYLEETF